MKRLLALFCLAVFGPLVFPMLALAVVPQHGLAFPSNQLWVLVIGALVPAVSYALNHWAPWASEPVRAVVLLVLSAAAGAAYAAIASNTFGWNTGTWELILSAVVSALAAHKLIWVPSGVSALLGGGSNAPRRVTRARRG